MRRSTLLIVAFVFACAATAADASVERHAGAFAIANATSPVTATLEVRRTSRLAADLDLVESVRGAPLRDYDTEMTQPLHLIVVSDDFSTFSHEHPVLDARGHFTLALRVPKPGRYYIFADGEPHGIGKTVFRFALDFGAAKHRAPRPISHGRRSQSGDYTVTLDSLGLHERAPTTIGVAIAKLGRPAPDLGPYLGGAAHAVFVDEATLDYVHVHPMPGASGSMPGMAMAGGMGEMEDLPANAKVSPRMRLRTGPLPAGRYALWLQFRGGGSLHVATFVLNAR